MCKLIVHADDFGLSEKVNEGILIAHTRGILTSTSIMPNGVAFDHAVSICKVTPSLDLGIHLTLVEERPVLPPETIPTLVNQKGRFHRHAFDFIKRYFSGRISVREIHLELDAQIRKVSRLNLSISHLDSHQHLHILPMLLKITVGLAKKYNILAIRFPCEKPRIRWLTKFKSASRLFQLLVLNSFCLFNRHVDLLRPDHFLGFCVSGNMNKENLLNALRHLPSEGISEVMCHPGLPDPHNLYSHWNYHWKDELTALIDSQVLEHIRHRKIELFSYRQLVEQSKKIN